MKASRRMTRRALSLIVLALVAVAVVGAGSGAAKPATPSWLPAPARTLAALDCRCPPSAARIARYQRVLDTLASRCVESRGRLAYISKTATEILRQSGHRRTNLWLLSEVSQAISTDPRRKQPCRFVFALVVESIL